MDLNEIIEDLYEKKLDLDFRADDITGNELKSLNRTISRVITEINYAKRDLDNIKNKIENENKFKPSSGPIKNGVNAKKDAMKIHSNISSELNKIYKKMNQYLIKTDKEYIRSYEKTDVIRCIADAKKLIKYVEKLNKVTNYGVSNFVFKFKSDIRHLLD